MNKGHWICIIVALLIGYVAGAMYPSLYTTAKSKVA